jgi:hypothetical protein
MRVPKSLSTPSLLLSLSLGFAAHGAIAQCASSVQENKIQCYNPLTQCSDSKTQIMPNFSQYGVMYLAGAITCCSTTYPSFVQGNSFICNGSGKLADPAIRQHLIELAKTDDIMVTSCRGEYRPLVIALSEQPSLKAPAQFDPTRMRTLFGIGGGSR